MATTKIRLEQVAGDGTAATKNVPEAGDATAEQVVLGSDTRLTDTREPAVHAPTHIVGGTDPLNLGQDDIPALSATKINQDVLSDAVIPTTIPRFVTAPTTASDTGVVGQMAYDINYFYVCVDTDTWRRTALNTWA